MNNFKLGIIAEYIVLILYLVCFYRILYRRYRTSCGEIDLIVVKGKTLVFIEVKARKYGVYEGIVSDRQIARIKNTAELFLSRNFKYQKYDIRFDFVLVTPYKLPMIVQNCWD